jgi:hypothetical protein
VTSAGDYVCNLCRDTGQDFRVPAGDPIGAALMRQHLAEHGLIVHGSSDPLEESA